MRRSRSCHGLVAPLVLLACQERPPAPQQPGLPAPAATATEPQAPPPGPDARRCGEAEETPTELPPEIAAGRTPVGEGALHPGETLTLGKVVLRYERDAWIGTMRAGSRGPALSLEIDRAEAGEGPWGAQSGVHPGQELQSFVGPYQIVTRCSAGEPPDTLTVRVTREVCPGAAVVEPSPAPQWLWVSSEGIRQHTYDLMGALLQVVLDTSRGAPRLVVSQLGYSHNFEPRPGPPRSLRVGRHVVTVDRVVPGPGTRFEGERWLADDDPRAHARVRIEPAPAPALAAPATPADPCGAPGPARTSLPAALASLPAAAETRTLELGQDARLGPLNLEYRTFEVPAFGHGPYREEARQVPNLLVIEVPPNSASLPGPYDPPRLARIGRQLVRVDPKPGGAPERIAVQRIAIACPKDQTFPRPAAPIYLWLSTFGHATAILGGPGPDTLTLQLNPDLQGPSLGMSAEQAYFVRTLGLDLAGQAFTLGAYRVEVVDVLTTGDTRHDGTRWQTSAPVPGLHVQLRVSLE